MKSWPLLTVGGLAAATIAFGQIASVDNADKSRKNSENAQKAEIAYAGGSPDVVVWEIYDWENFSSGSTRAYAIGTNSCNEGTAVLQWQSNNNQHPVIGQNMFRLAPGQNGHTRFEQIGQAWLKHGFCALSLSDCGPCNATPCSTLGIGCSDPYSAGLNASQGSAGPKYQVNATSGFFPYPPADPSYSGNVARRLQVASSDVISFQNPGAIWYVEAQYICSDDNVTTSIANAENNVSYRRVNLNGSGSIIGYNGSTQQRVPGIKAWQVADPSITYSVVRRPGEGTVVVASQAYDNGNGTWDYEYAVYNMNMDRSVGGIDIPADANVSITDEGFADVNYHSGEPFSGTDWPATRDSDSVSFATTQTFAQNQNANAIRWGTMYNMRFTADTGPVDGDVELSYFKPGSGTSFLVDAVVPDAGTVDTCPADIDNNNVVEFADLVALLSGWGFCPGCDADFNDDDFIDLTDLLTMLASWGNCP